MSKSAYMTGDALDGLRHYPEGWVDLIYADPPFFTKRDFGQFTDKWEGGMDEYLGWLMERVQEMHRVLKPTGSLYLHCNWHASHYIKVELDKIFGSSNFMDEIIWSKGIRKNGMVKRLPKDSESIFRYAKDADLATWNIDTFITPHDMDDLPEKTLKQYSHKDEDGRRYQLSPLTSHRPFTGGTAAYELMGVVRNWRWGKERMDQAMADGRIVQTKPGNVPRYKRYLDEQKGVLMTNVWTDIKLLQSKAKENTGYPTQKPEALLERIIKASSNEGDVVLDPFCGSGTTLAVAKKLGRRWIGIDISQEAIDISYKRVNSIENPNYL